MESFYGGQAEAYDDFRRRLLHGREELYRRIPVEDGMSWVDLGGGTGSNLEYIADQVPRLERVYVVDLSPSLLQVARQRFEAKGWSQASAILADATQWQPPEGAVDVVTFSYSDDDS